MSYNTQTPIYRIDTCSVCGRMFKSEIGVHSRQFCPTCLKSHNEYLEKLQKEQDKIKLILMHEVALKKIEKCRNTFKFTDLKDSIDAIEEMEKQSPSSFMSASEIVVAIGLYHEAFFFKINHKVLNYSIDFFMPDEKICLEIDGGLHDIGNTRFKDGRRDVEIRNELGGEWEIVRIPTSYSDRFPLNVGDRAIEIANKQRELRKKNQGHLPRGYSKSVDAYYAKVFD